MNNHVKCKQCQQMVALSDSEMHGEVGNRYSEHSVVEVRVSALVPGLLKAPTVCYLFHTTYGAEVCISENGCG